MLNPPWPATAMADAMSDQPSAPQATFLIGVDGGGTGTRARLTDGQGRVLGQGHAGPSGLIQGVEQAWTHVYQAVAMAVQQAGLSPADVPLGQTALGLGLAGANSDRLRHAFLELCPPYLAVSLQDDAHIALLGAHGGQPGGVLSVGTGSVGVALHADGRTQRVGGWGFPSGDEGSGADLGLKVANHVQQVMDGRSQQQGALYQAALDIIGPTPQAVLEWCCQAGQSQFASLAPLVLECEHDDPFAARLVNEALEALHSMVQALDPQGDLPLCLLGGLGQRLSQRLSQRLAHRCQRQWATPMGDAMAGALWLCKSGNAANPVKASNS